MTKYELSLSANYVPSWGVVEAVRELFQNALDEETKDSANKLFFNYDSTLGVLQIGNKNSTLDINTLLIGETSKNGDKYIGQHGEGYKIAMMVLLRTGHEVTFYNYNKREVWTTKLVKSRKYQGALVPTVYVEKVPLWQRTQEHSLVIVVSNVTPEEYEAVKATNLHIQGMPEHKATEYGNILTDKAFSGHVYVSGLFVCKNDKVHYGYDFVPSMINLDRDRRLVDTFNLCWTAAKLIAKTNEVAFIKGCLKYEDGRYLSHADYSMTVADSVATDFIQKYGDAAPVSNQSSFNMLQSQGVKAIMVSEAEADLITKSTIYNAPVPTVKPLIERIEEWYAKLRDGDDYIGDTIDEFEQLLNELRGVL